MVFYMYVLQSESTERYYIGHTQELQERLAYHNANYSRALKNRGPWKLVYFEEYPTRAEAMRRERYLKKRKDRKYIDRLVSASR